MITHVLVKQSTVWSGKGGGKDVGGDFFSLQEIGILRSRRLQCRPRSALRVLT